MADLSPPQHISNDGREVWDWAARLSQHTHRLDRVRILRADIQRISNKCGSCSYWMTKSCPLERSGGLSGYSQGPSSDHVACGQFDLRSIYADLISEKQAELSELLTLLAPKASA